MELFVFDIDGTLAKNFGKPTKATSDALNAILDKGDYVCLASGRCKSGILRYLGYLKDSKNKFCIASNGAAIYDQDGKLIKGSYLRYSDFLYIKEKYEMGRGIAYFYKDNVLGSFSPDAEICKLEYELNNMDEIVDLNKTPWELDMPIEKALVAALPEDSKYIESKLDEEDLKNYHIVRSSPNFLEFVRNCVDKASGIELLADHLGIQKDHIHAFGDSMNDYLMVRTYDGTAMGNALEPVKKAAKRITKNVEDDGVAYALERWFDIKA